MKNRVKILKSIVSFCKKRKVPVKCITAILVVTLLALYIANYTVELIKKFLAFLMPDRKMLVNYTVLGIFSIGLLCWVIEINNGNGKVYGDSVQNNIEKATLVDSQNNQDNIEQLIASGGQIASNGEIASSGELNIENNLNVEDLTPSELKAMQFYIKVNRAYNCITIYTLDDEGDFSIPVKAMICSTGGLNTPLGTYNTTQKYTFRKLLFNVYGQYATRIVDQILFHSSSYNEPKNDSLIADEFNKLGEAVSHGCIRLTVEDAKWIYDYCEIGTTVEIYDDYESPGPLGRPEAIKIPSDSVWDPTDDAEDNPWNDDNPEIQGADDKYVTLGYQPDLMEGIIAKDTCGNDITSSIEVTGEVDAYKVGVYEITYTVVDLIGRTDSVTVKYTVR